MVAEIDWEMRSTSTAPSPSPQPQLRYSLAKTYASFLEQVQSLFFFPRATEGLVEILSVSGA
jgi:hypothetical protein